MKKFKRVFLIVIDSLGIGEMPDAADYGDVGVDTLGQYLSVPATFIFQIFKGSEWQI